MALFTDASCVSVIGMAAAGKSTIGREMAKILGWAHVDSDHLIEAAYGARLQKITDSMSKDEFLDVEAAVIKSIRLGHCVVSTGGSVVYRQEAVEHLQAFGPLIYIKVPLPIILERISRKPDRGLAIAPGQTIEELFIERQKLYEAAATITIEGGDAPPSIYARKAVELLLCMV